MTSGVPLVDRALGLFTFLQKAQQLKERPVRDLDSYKRDEGMTQWLQDLPEHPAIQWSSEPPEIDSPIITIDRLSAPEPPKVPLALVAYVVGGVEDPSDRPVLLLPVVEEPQGETDGQDPDSGTPDVDHDMIQQSFNRWITQWDTWAEVEKTERPVREFYSRLFRAHNTATQNAEQRELILGTGFLTWDQPGYDRVRRHLFVNRVTVELDEQTGTLSVLPDRDAAGVTAELDMLDPSQFPTKDVPAEIESRAEQFTAHPLDRYAVAQLARPTILGLDPEGQYLDCEKNRTAGPSPVMTWSPALILRPRPKFGVAQAFEKIVEAIKEAEEVPDGLRTLVDPDEAPRSAPDNKPGALVTVDDQIYSPLPLNDVQLRILHRVDTSAQTLVQGPPGTGKTHTAAALLAHLLAQGKRVLVTAHTDRALYEVRNKLPEQIRPLAVSVIGTSRDDMAQLRTAVETMTRRSTDHDHDKSHAEIETLTRTIDDLRITRQGLNNKLIDVRERETQQHRRGHYSGTLATIAQALHAERDKYDWVTKYTTNRVASAERVTGTQASAWLQLFNDQALIDFRSESSKAGPEVRKLPTPNDFARLCRVAAQAESEATAYTEARTHPAFEPLLRWNSGQRSTLKEQLIVVLNQVNHFQSLHVNWVRAAVRDVLLGRTQFWQTRQEEAGGRLGRLDQLMHELGPDTRVEATGDPQANLNMADTLRVRLASGTQLKLHADGSAKLSFLASPVVKQCRPFLDNVRVNGRAAVTVEAIDEFKAHQEALWLLRELDAIWGIQSSTSALQPIASRSMWHRDHLGLLTNVLALRTRVNAIDAMLPPIDFPTIDWSSNDSVTAYALVIDAVEKEMDHRDAKKPFEALSSDLASYLNGGSQAGWVDEIETAIRQRHSAEYARAINRGEELEQARRRIERLDNLTHELNAYLPDLVTAVRQNRLHAEWEAKLQVLSEALHWEDTRKWLEEQDSIDVNKVQQEITEVEAKIRDAVESMSALRAWNHAVGPDRLTYKARSFLTQYSQLVKQLGKGTGKYAASKKADIRRALDRCRDSVPVWIMPIYRVVEQLQISENMFDVVLIDEASQAGLEATFLQYLAPKIVVIGDDKQVSPVAVGVDHQALRDLAAQYIPTDPYRSSWQNPQRSLFDEAVMRYGGQLTLREHRRSVPEIIGFSNAIAYAPDNIPLIPVRQFGADRLEPFKIVHTADGYVVGTSTSLFNKHEADALINQVVECASDPRYEEMTFGIITLVGQAQSKYIEQQLLETLPAEEWKRRELQIGAPPDFQGAERHVIFLSMVSAVRSGSQLGSHTQDSVVQRYNVAVSRARDQVWLFHTIRQADISNEEDLRFRLLEYAYGVRQRGRELNPGESPSVPDNERVEPFDSLFEQRIYNRIIDRGFTVQPQFEALGYRIDLVIVGATGRIAVECDGDAWHGPDAYTNDLARQRDLERCGWIFFRVRESVFYSDPAAALEPLWELLRERGIRTSDYLIDDDSDHPTNGAASDLRHSEVSDPSEESRSTELTPLSSLEGEEAATMGPASAVPETLPFGKGMLERGENELFRRPAAEPMLTTREFSLSLGVGHDNDSVSDQQNDAEPQPSSYRASDISDFDNRNSQALHLPRNGSREAPKTEEYVEYTGQTASVSGSRREAIIDGIVDIVMAEGPVTGERLQRSYIVAAGGKRGGKTVLRTINSAIHEATRTGRIVADNPLNREGVKLRTYRLASQPSARIRTLGPRSLEEVPPNELASVMRTVIEEHSGASDEEIMRSTLERLGRKALTQAARRVLVPILGLCGRSSSTAHQV